MTFKDLGLSSNLLSAIADAGYDTPTPIQAGAIPVALTGRDVLGHGLPHERLVPAGHRTAVVGDPQGPVSLTST